ncbi:hypothetical protein CUJ91_17700 [Paraburkholderia graminis]|nr:hypothetical protein CUJ91_17700 [Paraburkholderia graminis]
MAWARGDGASANRVRFSRWLVAAVCPMRFVGRIYPPISSVLASLLSREPGRVDRLQITRGAYVAARAGRPLRSLRDLLQDCAAAP